MKKKIILKKNNFMNTELLSHINNKLESIPSNELFQHNKKTKKNNNFTLK